ncbi:MAG TPA: hypothetical protein VMA53_07010 [Stellaceae bacterium]|nr:hypothetical protein [Stellaceae bacterium]
MTTLYRVSLSKAQLDKIPHDERVFYLMASQLSNDLNVLAKLLFFAANHLEDEVRTHVAMAQELLIIKMMAGRLHEGRTLLSKAFSAKGLWDKHKRDLSPKARDSFDQINKYFGRQNVIETIRNKFAFHLDVTLIDSMYDQVPSDVPFIDYVAAEHAGHSLHFGGEWMTLAAMVNAAGGSDWRDALTKIYRETTQVSVWFCFFIQSFVGVILAKHLEMTMEDLQAAAIEVADDPPINEVTLPFFCPPPSGGIVSWF